jgi:hypothetical protein
MYIWIGARSKDGSQKVEHAFLRTKTFKHIDQFRRPNLIMILDCHLHDNLQVLAIAAEQIIKAFQASLWNITKIWLT